MTSSLEARGHLLEALRLSRGLTQSDVASQTSLSQATLSKMESGALPVDQARWVEVANLLEIPVEAFDTVPEWMQPARIFHRKRKTTPQGAVRKVGAELSLVRYRLEGLLGDRRTTLKRHDLEDGFVTPSEVAAEVRAELGVGDGPIPDLVALMEEAGVTVVRWPLQSIQVDAVASWQQDTAPVILIGEHVPAERQRFTMAHELGHAIMHDHDANDAQEAEADEFAAEFLLPRQQLVAEWPKNASVDALLALKKKWGISLAALIRRGRDSDQLTEDEYRDWSIRLSTTGMHRHEPDPGVRENPTALSNAVKAARASGNNLDQIATRAFMSTLEFKSTFLEKTS